MDQAAGPGNWPFALLALARNCRAGFHDACLQKLYNPIGLWMNALHSLASLRKALLLNVPVLNGLALRWVNVYNFKRSGV